MGDLPTTGVVPAIIESGPALPADAALLLELANARAQEARALFARYRRAVGSIELRAKAREMLSAASRRQKLVYGQVSALVGEGVAFEAAIAAVSARPDIMVEPKWGRYIYRRERHRLETIERARREVEMLELVKRGRTNRQIACKVGGPLLAPLHEKSVARLVSKLLNASGRNIDRAIETARERWAELSAEPKRHLPQGGHELSALLDAEDVFRSDQLFFRLMDQYMEVSDELRALARFLDDHPAGADWVFTDDAAAQAELKRGASFYRKAAEIRHVICDTPALSMLGVGVKVCLAHMVAEASESHPEVMALLAGLIEDVRRLCGDPQSRHAGRVLH